MTAAAMAGPPIPFGGVAPNGPGVWDGRMPAVSDFALAAANSARIMYGHVITSDGASHTFGTSSKLGWLPGAVTLIDAASTIVIGLATLDTATGPAGRATNSSNTITPSMSVSFAGNGAHGITATTWHEPTITTGTPFTVANGDLLAAFIQLTARGGSDSVAVRCGDSGLVSNFPGVTNLTGPSTYAGSTATPNCFLTFDDGAFGYFLGSQVFSVTSTGTGNFNSSSGTNEYGNLFQFPFPCTILGASLFAVGPNGNFDVVLYSDPLGTPSAQKTVSVDANVLGSTANSRRLDILFPAGYAVAANAPVALIMKPTTATTIAAVYRSVFASSHQVTMNLGTGCYAVDRGGGSGAFTARNTNRFNICLLVSAFDDGAGGGTGGGSTLRIDGNRILTV